MGNSASVDERQRTPGGVRSGPPGGGSYPAQPYYPSVRPRAVRRPFACLSGADRRSQTQHLYSQQPQARQGGPPPSNGAFYGGYPGVAPSGYPPYAQARARPTRPLPRPPLPCLGLAPHALARPFSRARPPRQQPPAPARAPEQTQRTNTIRNNVNLKKPTLKIVPVPEVRLSSVLRIAPLC